MADEKKTWLLNIESNLKEYADEAVQTKKKIDDLKTANDLLVASGQKGSAQYELNVAQLKLLQKEYSQTQRNIGVLTAANKANATTRDKLNAIVTIETQKLKALGDGYITNAAGITKLNPLYVKQKQALADANLALIKYDQSLNSGKTNVGRYGETVKSAFAEVGKSLFAFALPAAAAATALNGLKEAFLGTEAGAKLLNTATLQLKTFFQAIVQGNWRYAFGGQLPKDIEAIGEMMDEIRKKDRVDLVEIAKMESNIKDLRLKSVDATKSHSVQLGYLKKAEEAENSLIEYRIKDKQHELDVVNQMLAKAPENTEFLNKKAELEAEIITARTESSLRLAIQVQSKVKEATADAIKLYQEEVKLNDIATQAQIDNYKIIETVAKQGYEDAINQTGLSYDEREALYFQYTQDIRLFDEAILREQKVLLESQRASALKQIDMKVQDEKLSAAERLAINAKYDADELKLQEEFEAKRDADTVAGNKRRRDIVIADNEAMIEADKLHNENLYQNKYQFLDNLETILKAEHQIMIKSVEWETKSAKQKRVIDEQYTAAKKQLSQARISQNISEMNQLGESFGKLASVFEANTEAAKVFGVAQATIAVYTAAAQAMANWSTMSYIEKIAAALAIIAEGMTLINKIKSVNIGSGSSSYSPTVISSHAIAPTVQPSGTTIFTQPIVNQTQTAAIQNQNAINYDDLAKALSNMPNPIVTVEDINARQAAVQKVAVRANI